MTLCSNFVLLASDLDCEGLVCCYLVGISLQTPECIICETSASHVVRIWLGSSSVGLDEIQETRLKKKSHS